MKDDGLGTFLEVLGELAIPWFSLDTFEALANIVQVPYRV